MGNWTPGPWRTSESGLRMIVRSEDGRIIAVRHRIGAIEHEANARLIAAAPELLEACQTFAEWLRREEDGSAGQPWQGKRDTEEGERAWREWWNENLRICDLSQTQVRAAIAKATGQQP